MAASPQELKQKFQEVDRDGNGYISSDEAFTILQRELGFTADKTKRFLHVYDKNQDGKLSYDEFIPFYFSMKGKKDELQSVFHQMDKDGNGAISFEEATLALKGLFSPEELRRLFELHDTNKDGKLQFDEFIQFWSV